MNITTKIFSKSVKENNKYMILVTINTYSIGIYNQNIKFVFQ